MMNLTFRYCTNRETLAVKHEDDMPCLYGAFREVEEILETLAVEDVIELSVDAESSFSKWHGGSCREQAVYHFGNVALIAGKIETEDEIYYLSADGLGGGTRRLPNFVKEAVEKADAVIDAALEKLHAQYEEEEAEAAAANAE